jgi:N utilization substance protein B
MMRPAAARGLARRIALQALYAWQLNPQPWQDLLHDFGQDEAAAGADLDYLRDLLEGVCTSSEALDAQLAAWGQLPGRPLDPVERAALLIGLFELRGRLDVPFKVAISEAVNLTRKFGATDGHKFVNAVLDRAARELRPLERAPGP